MYKPCRRWYAVKSEACAIQNSYVCRRLSSSARMMEIFATFRGTTIRTKCRLHETSDMYASHFSIRLYSRCPRLTVKLKLRRVCTYQRTPFGVDMAMVRFRAVNTGTPLNFRATVLPWSLRNNFLATLTYSKASDQTDHLNASWERKSIHGTRTWPSTE